VYNIKVMSTFVTVEISLTVKHADIIYDNSLDN